MLARSIQFVALLIFVIGALATPTIIPPKKEVVSFNNYGGFASLANFDEFNGKDNFDGRKNKQTIIVREKELVCRAQKVQIIQQRLTVLQEMAKRIITEQVCEVEVQTIVFNQFLSGMGRFQDDLRRKDGRKPGHDQNVVRQFPSLVDSNGTLSTNDLGFKGADVGNNTVIVKGDNWNNKTSPTSVEAAISACKAANNETKS